MSCIPLSITQVPLENYKVYIYIIDLFILYILLSFLHDILSSANLSLIYAFFILVNFLR